MDSQFYINEDYDLRLLPYSPVYEQDEVEIRCQVYNSGDDGETELVFCLDGQEVHREIIEIKSHTYGLARCRVSMEGKCGSHKVTVNGASCNLEVLKEPRAALDGGFVMLGPPNDRMACDSFRKDVKSMTDSDWKRYIAELAGIEQTCVIIMVSHQWNLLEAPQEQRYLQAHYDSQIYPKSDIAGDDPIAAILEEAEKHDIKVFLGIGNQYGYAGRKEDVQELFARYGKYRAFYGWYLARELNMKRFRKEDWDVLSEITGYARELSPVKPILNSPMSLPVDECLTYLLENDVMDIMMPQDWVGQKQQNLEESREMHRLLLTVCEKTGKHLWANCEAFNFVTEYVPGEPVPTLVPRFLDGGMDGEAGFLQQMQTVRHYVEKIMCFMFNGFFTPPGFEPKIGGDAAVKQFEEYVKMVNKAP